MKIDPVLAEIRRTREAYAERFTGDVRAMLADIRQRQQQGGRKVIARAPKRRNATGQASIPASAAVERH